MSTKKKSRKVTAYFSWNVIYPFPGIPGMWSGQLLGISFSYHVPDKTWVVVLHFFLINFSFGFVDHD